MERARERDKENVPFNSLCVLLADLVSHSEATQTYRDGVCSFIFRQLHNTGLLSSTHVYARDRGLLPTRINGSQSVKEKSEVLQMPFGKRQTSSHVLSSVVSFTVCTWSVWTSIRLTFEILVTSPKKYFIFYKFL